MVDAKEGTNWKSKYETKYHINKFQVLTAVLLMT